LHQGLLEALTAEKGWNTTPDSCTSSCAACTLTLRLGLLLETQNATDTKDNVSYWLRESMSHHLSHVA
jgi:hypothetical protein